MSETEFAIESQIDVEEREIARVYAQAAWKSAVDQGIHEDFYKEFQSLITDVLDNAPDVGRFFTTPSIGQQKREAVLRKIFEGRVSPLLFNFLLNLNLHERLRYVRAIGHCLHDLYNKHTGRVTVVVRTAVPLEDDQKQAVKDMVAQKFSIDPDMVTQVDPSLLGGLYLRVGDRVFDRTVRYNFRNLKDNVLARGK